MKDPCVTCEHHERRNRFIEQSCSLANGNDAQQHSPDMCAVLQKIKASDEHFEILTDAAFDAVLIHHQGKLIKANQQCLDMYGYTFEELQAIPISQTLTPESLDIVMEKISTGQDGVYEASAIRKDGTVFPIEIRAKEVTLNGQPVRIAAFRDLTEQNMLQQELMESEEKYRELYSNARACLFRTRVSDGMLMDCSRATARLLGYTNEAEYKNNFSVADTYADPQKRELLIETLKKDKRVHNFEVELKRKDGSAIWVAISAEIFPEKDCIEGAMHDITVTKALSKTEYDILKQLMRGMSNKEIAFQTGRSVRTIEDHRAHIMQKLGVENIIALTQKAMKLPEYHHEQ